VSLAVRGRGRARIDPKFTHPCNSIASGTATVYSCGVRRGPQPLGRIKAIAVVSVTFALLCACGDTGSDAESPSATSPAPDDMCDNGQVPQAVAYGLDDGSFRWVSCTEGNAYRSVRAVTDDAVYVQSYTGSPEGDTIALDPADGTILPDAPDLPPDESPSAGPIEVDGLTVTGGQDDPTAVHDATGNQLWSQPGVWVYDDVWAIDDGAVFAIERNGVTPRLVAYELSTGEIRWEHVGDPYVEGLWPWHAEDGRLFTVWDNLQVRDTSTGEALWTTSYPPSLNPDLRISGIDVDDQAVYAGFGSAPSGGD
jgi:outer membrane protein assembly factor BamB